MELARADALMDLVLDHCDVTVVVHTTRAADDHAAPSSNHVNDADPSSNHANDAARSSNDVNDAATTASDSALRPAGHNTTHNTTEPHAAEKVSRPARGAAADATTPPQGATEANARPAAGEEAVKAGTGAGAASWYADAWAGFPAPASDDAAGGAEGLVEVGGFAGPGTTFLPHGYLDAAGTTDPIRGLTCHPTTGALLTGDVPASLARGQARARAVQRARERNKDRAKDGVNSNDDEPMDFAESYRVPDGMARLIRLRDGTCRFPGCAVPARQCDLDHVRPWPIGPTSPINLMALCRRHHRIKQRDGWTASLHPDATVTWTDPTGYTTTTRPVDHLHLLTTHRNEHAPTDTATPGRPGSARPHRPRVPILTDFEEALADLLDTTTSTHPHQSPRGGPLPRIDLDTLENSRTSRTATRHTLVLDYPPRPPRAAHPPEEIPF